MKEKKRNLGQYFTKDQVWLQPQVKRFIDKVNPMVVVDPFAGVGDLLKVAEGIGYTNTKGFDIDPVLEWSINDGLKTIPKINKGLILTNPPFLAKNSAKRRSLDGYSYFSGNKYQDLYQIAVYQALKACRFSVFIIPETFLNSTFFSEYIDSLTVLESNPFSDTECPVCVCCFDVKRSGPFDIYKDGLFLFDSDEASTVLNKYKSINSYSIEFNNKEGNLGLRGVDGVNCEDRIRFCRPKDLGYDLSIIKHSSRAITVIDVEVKVTDKLISRLNYYVEDYRTKTHDVFMSPFKNNNHEGCRRRRFDFKLARNLINIIIENQNTNTQV